MNVPDDQIVVVFFDYSKKPLFTGRIAFEDNKRVLERNGYEKIQAEKANYIVNFFKEHNEGKKKINYSYRVGVNSPDNALIAQYNKLTKKWGLTDHAKLSPNDDYYFIGYAVRRIDRTTYNSKFVLPFKYIDILINCIKPYFEIEDYEYLKREITFSYELKKLNTKDVEAITSI